MELRDDQPGRHELGRRVYRVADVEPLDLDGIRTVTVGSALWLLAFVGLLPFWSRLEEAGRLWWVWTCMAGLGLGLFGLEYCRRRKTARESRESQAAADDAAPPTIPPALPGAIAGRDDASRGGSRAGRGTRKPPKSSKSSTSPKSRRGGRRRA